MPRNEGVHPQGPAIQCRRTHLADRLKVKIASKPERGSRVLCAGHSSSPPAERPQTGLETRDYPRSGEPDVSVSAARGDRGPAGTMCGAATSPICPSQRPVYLVALDPAFCLEALENGRPEICNTDEGAQFTSAPRTGRVEAAVTWVSTAGRGRLWCSLQYEDVYLKD